MMREMRRKTAAMSEEKCMEIIQRNHSGVMALVDPDGMPYGVPMSYAMADGKIIIHSATEGYKVDCLKNNPRVCFTIVDYDELSVEGVTNYYRSVMIFGTAEFVEDNEAKFQYISKFTDILVGKPMRPCMPAVREGSFPMDIILITPEHISGKSSEKDTAPQYEG